MSNHTAAIHIDAMEIDGSKMTLPGEVPVVGAIHIRRHRYSKTVVFWLISLFSLIPGAFFKLIFHIIKYIC